MLQLSNLFLASSGWPSTPAMVSPSTSIPTLRSVRRSTCSPTSTARQSRWRHSQQSWLLLPSWLWFRSTGDVKVSCSLPRTFSSVILTSAHTCTCIYRIGSICSVPTIINYQLCCYRLYTSTKQLTTKTYMYVKLWQTARLTEAISTCTCTLYMCV